MLVNETRACPSADYLCGSGLWSIQRDAMLPDLWQVTNTTDGSTWTVAASEPVCPRCGMTLMAILEPDSLPNTRIHQPLITPLHALLQY